VSEGHSRIRTHLYKERKGGPPARPIYLMRRMQRAESVWVARRGEDGPPTPAPEKGLGQSRLSLYFPLRAELVWDAPRSEGGLPARVCPQLTTLQASIRPDHVPASCAVRKAR